MWIRNILLLLILLVVPVALARPQTEETESSVTKEGIDIVVALDVSQSMAAEDLQPNRLEAAKASLEQFVSELEDDRLGVVVFAGQAFTQSPLTFDYGILTEYIKGITLESIYQRAPGLGGTAVGDAILAGVNRLEDSEATTKLIVLITDGDANTGIDPMIAVQKAADEGITVYTIGVGTAEGAPIPVVNQLGQKTYATNADGSLQLAMFNEQALVDMAAIGGGQYFRADDNARFAEIMEEIRQLEKSEIQTEVQKNYEDDYQGWLWLSVSLLFFWLVSLLVKPIIR